MLKYVTIAIAAFCLASPALAASKAQVAQAGCRSLDQAKELAPNYVHFKYRLIGGKECWYNEAALTKQLTAARAQVPRPPKNLTETPPDNQIAGTGPIPSSLARKLMRKFTQPKTPEPVNYDTLDPNNGFTPEELNRVFELLCGGPCPQLQKK